MLSHPEANVISNGRCSHQKQSIGVLNDGSRLDSYNNLICRKPDLASMMESTLASNKDAITSSIVGIG